MSSAKRKSIEEQRLKAQQWRDSEFNSNKRSRTRSKSPGAVVLNQRQDIEEQRLRAKIWSETELSSGKGSIPEIKEEVTRSPVRSPIRSPMRPQQQQQRGREIFSTSISASPKRPMITSKPSMNSYRKPSPSPSRVKSNNITNSYTKSSTYTTYIKDIHSPIVTPKFASSSKSSRQKGPFTIEDSDADTERYEEIQDDGYSFNYANNDVVSSDDGTTELVDKEVTQNRERESKQPKVDTTKGRYDGYIVMFFLVLGFGFSILHYCYEKAGPVIAYLKTNYIPATATFVVLLLSVAGVQLYFYRRNYLRIRKCVVNRVVHLIVQLLGNVPEDYLDGYPIDFLAHDVIQEIQSDSWDPTSDITAMYSDVKGNPRAFIERVWKDIRAELAKDNRIKTLDRLVDGKQHKCYKLRGIRAAGAGNSTPKPSTSPSKLFHY